MRSSAQTPDIHFVPTTNDVADAMLRLAHVTSDDIVYDLGSGEGAIVLRAAEKFGARGVGIEIDPKLVKTANDRARKRGLAGKVTFIEGDLFKADISQATVVTLYLSGSINRRLAPKLMAELKPGARVVSHRSICTTGARTASPRQEDGMCFSGRSNRAQHFYFLSSAYS